jgi:hypothetical protein
MKKLILLFSMLLLTVTVFCQAADSTLIPALTGVGISKTVSWLIAGALALIVGHLAVPQSWASVLTYVEKILFLVYSAIAWFNDKTNKASKKQKKDKEDKKARNKKIQELIKQGVLVITLLFMVGAVNAQSHPLRWYPFKTGEYVAANPDDLTISEAMKDSTIYFGPSVSFDVFQRESKTGDYTLGVLPGIGYGVKWNPFKWEDSYLVGLDLFVQADVNESSETNNAGETIENKYFTIDFLPVVTILNWIHIGYGPRWNIGLNGTKNMNTGVFLIGITKTL